MYQYVRSIDHEALVEAFRLVDETLEEVARKRRVPLISPDGVVQRDLVHFYDHVHLKPPGTAAVAQSVAARLIPLLRGHVQQD